MPVRKRREPDCAERVNWCGTLEAVFYDSISRFPVLFQPFICGGGNFLVERTSATVQKNVASSHDLSPQGSNELAAQVRISGHIP